MFDKIKDWLVQRGKSMIVRHIHIAEMAYMEDAMIEDLIRKQYKRR